MSLNIFNALSFPYRRTNLLQAWLIPGTFLLLIEMIGATSLYTVQIFNLASSQGIQDGIQILVLLAKTILICGFLWQMTRNMQEKGDNALLPSWWQGFSGYVVSGIKAFPYILLCLAINLGLALLLRTLIPIVPQENSVIFQTITAICITILFMTIASIPIIQSAHSQSLAALMNFKKSLPLFRNRFLQGLIAATIGLFFSILYSASIEILPQYFEWALYLKPYLMIAMLVTIWHLLSQALSPAQDVSEQLPAVS